MLTLILTIGVAGFIIWVTISSARMAEQQLAAYRSAAQTQFRTWLQTPAAAQLHLGPVPIEPVHFIEDMPPRKNQRIDHYCLTWFLRNEDGHYVMLMSTTNEKPFVKLLEDRYAKVVLKAKYQAPA